MGPTNRIHFCLYLEECLAEICFSTKTNLQQYDRFIAITFFLEENTNKFKRG